MGFRVAGLSFNWLRVGRSFESCRVLASTKFSTLLVNEACIGSLVL